MCLQRWHGWCRMKLLPSRRVLCTPYKHAPCHFMQSHIHKVYAYLAVTCHLHFWQHDWGLLRATAVTQRQQTKVTVGANQFWRCQQPACIVMHCQPTELTHLYQPSIFRTHNWFCMCTHACTHTHARTHARTHAHAHTHIHTHTHKRTNKQTKNNQAIDQPTNQPTNKKRRNALYEKASRSFTTTHDEILTAAW